jgi:outer membrane protein assembly factor BamD
MRSLKFCSVILAGVILAACGGQKSADLQSGAVAPDTTLFESGMKYMEKNGYIKARLSFQTLINTYPDSEYTPIAFLSIADSYYKEGGTENLLQAEAQFKDFIIFYPTHEMADDAQMKIAAINVRLMRPSDRDPTYTRKAEKELLKLLSDYPDSELAPTAQEFLREVRQNLALGIHQKAEFYYGRKRYQAAENRFQEVLRDYEDFSRGDETNYLLARSLEEMDRIDQAAARYAILASEYPYSKYADEAREKLTLLERPIPEIDEEKAAQNQANVRIENFSIWDPIRSVWRTFTGGPDVYEIARQRAEERRAAAAAASPPQGNNEGNSN